MIVDKRLKLYRTKINSVGKDKKSIRFRISDDSIDRCGEKVNQSWNLKNFLKNPIGPSRSRSRTVGLDQKTMDGKRPKHR